MLPRGARSSVVRSDAKGNHHGPPCIRDGGREAGRPPPGSGCPGGRGASLDYALQYALERKQFGRQLADFDATQAKIANMAARVAASRSSILDVGERLQAVREGGVDTGAGADSLAVLAAGAKLLASETAMYASDEAVQIFGGYGYMRDYPVERLMRDAKGTEIFEGTSEIMRVVIAREIIRAASDD